MSCTNAPRPGSKDKAQNLQVFVRVRPLNEQEISHRSQSAAIVKGRREIVVNAHTTPNIAKTYTFDGVFGPNVKQAEIYQRVLGQTIADVIGGFNCTLFAYGQTGSGKTYTMEGDLSEGGQGAQAGIIPRAMSTLFDELRLQKAEFTVRISLVELYNEEIFDLFSTDDFPPKLRLYDDPAKKGSVIIQSLEELLVQSKGQVLEKLNKGLAKRQVAATQMNAISSRSHTVFCATVHTKENNLEGEELVKFGKLYLVDLAGSENIARSGSVDKRAREAGSINQSLLTLGRVVACLVERQPHVPYRESKLTRILQDSLGGCTKTTIIATISPAVANVEETLSTLDYALKAKCVRNRPEVNQKVSKEAVMKEYALLIDGLKKKLNLTREGSGIYIATENYQSLIESLEKEKKNILEITAEIRVCVNERKRYERLFEELSNQMSSKKELLEEVKQNLKQTTGFVQESKVELERERNKLAETSELVVKSNQYEEHIQSQAKNFIAIVEECQDDRTHLHSKVDSSGCIAQHNLQYAKSLVIEMHRLRESVCRRITEFKGASAALRSLCEELKTLKDDNEEIKTLKNLAYSTRDRLLLTLSKFSGVVEDQSTYKAQWNRETQWEVNERCNHQMKQYALLENELKAAFDVYAEFTKTIAATKGAISETVSAMLNVWRETIENVSKATAKGLRTAADFFVLRVDEGEKILHKISSSANDFGQLEDNFAKERSEAVNEVLQSAVKLQKILDAQDAASRSALSNTEKLVEEAGEYHRTCVSLLTDTLDAVREDTKDCIKNSFVTAKLSREIEKDTEALSAKMDSLPNTIANAKRICEETCSENTSAWSRLLTDMEEGLEAREKESRDTLLVEGECLEGMRKELAELDQKYPEETEKFYDKCAKFRKGSGQTFKNVTDISANIRSDLEDQVKTQSTLVRTFVYDQFQRDCPTGETPPRKDMRIPPLEEPLASPVLRRIIRKVDEAQHNDL